MEFTRVLFSRYPAPVCDAGRIGGTEHVPRGLREARLLLRGRLWRTLGRRGGLGCRQRGEGRTCPRAVRSIYLSSRLSLQRLHHANLKTRRVCCHTLFKKVCAKETNHPRQHAFWVWFQRLRSLDQPVPCSSTLRNAGARGRTRAAERRIRP